MIPSTLLGLVVFAASIGPGYVWVRVAETRVPRGKRTQLLEVAELLIVGGIFSTLAFLAVFALADRMSWIDTDALATEGTAYILRHPTRGFSAVFVGLVLAYLGALGAALFRYRKHPANIDHGYNAWHSMFRPAADRVTYATVDLRGGTAVAGWVHLYTVDEVPLADRDLVLKADFGKPLKVRPPTADTFSNSPDRFIILNGSDVFAVAASYYSEKEQRRLQRRLQIEVDRALAEFAADKGGAPPPADTR